PESVAAFVGGGTFSTEGASSTYIPRPVRIVEAPADKRIELSVGFVERPLTAPPDEPIWPYVADAVKKHIERNRSTLVFTNSRRTCERLTLYLNRDEDDLIAYAHHGSLSKDIRRVVEERLKNGELRAIVAT